MKKASRVVLAVALLASVVSPVLAAETASYEEMKKIKAAQRAEREAKKANTTSGPKESTFWSREGERSGLGQTGGRVGTFLHNLNPVPFFKSQREAYESRKKAGTPS